jgi:long-subunit acyl-CoA synthetase (AMP-forming)
LIKLQGGEYVSLNKVEAVVKLLPFVENCCVIANPLKEYCIVLICPNLKNMTKNVVGVELDTTNFYESIEKDKQLNKNLNKIVFEHCLKRKWILLFLLFLDLNLI